jgi:phosphatidylglycerol:prolipoprotein diacylglycerol transferase
VLTHPDFDPVLIAIGPLKIHWYGVMYLIAFAAAWWLARRRTRLAHCPLQKEHVDDLIFYGALGVVLGGRFGYVMFYNFEQFLANPLWLLKVWEGGMSFHGGLLGVIVAMFLYARRLRLPVGSLLDNVAPIVPIGLGMGRLGNFIGQELWGRASDVPWAMVFPKDSSGLARHPSQLYQATLEGLVLFVALYWFASKPRPRWAVGGLFMALYGFFRFIVEFFRQPDSHIGFDLMGWMTRGQLLSMPMILIGMMLMIWAYRAGKNN